MTYEQLDKKSNHIARYLSQIGVKIETLVAIHLNQDMYMIPWILGILKTGGAYVPIDKTYPAERKNHIIKDSEVSYLITDEECNDWVENFSGKMIQSNTMDVTKQSDHIIESVGHGENLCYVMYTSGSTGKPKGVLIEHKNVTSLLMDSRYDHFKYKDGGIRVLQVLSIAFDASLIGWAMAITNGSTICFAKNPKFLVGNYLLDVIKCNEIEAMNVVPSILATISPDDCSPTLKYLEVGVIATNYDILTEKDLVTMGSAIGTPRELTSIYICDPITQELVSDKGEILIGGIGLARGFLKRDDITKERFIFHPKLQKRLYRTGDQGYILEDGKIIYLGRFDRQVKLRGLRIELSEVEAVILSKCPEICRVSVQVNEEKKSLAAFVMPKNLDHKVIQNKLNKTMVKFQIPDIIPVDNLPCTDNGKTDHAKIKNIMPKLLKKTIESEIPRSQPKSSKVSLISHLQAIWQDILALEEKPDINTNFFDLGGHSLLLLQLQKKIQLQISSVDLASSNDQAINESEIAIISMVGCFPGAKSVNEFWNMIKAGQHGIHTFTDKELDEMNVKNRNDPHYVPKCGVLSNIDKFDAEFFKISYQEAVSMDPQQRLLLEKSVQALDEAGINPQYEKGRIGVFVAIEKSTYKNYSFNNENDLAKKYNEELNTSSGSAATRIAYHLNLKGPEFSLNSTCSSSLTALKTAWNSIQCGDCDVAIVGAASIILPQSGYLAQPGHIFSANGICRPFYHNSDGTIIGNSVSVIVLKRLLNAISDKNPISAIIKSIELNNDGNNKIGYTAPSIDGQYNLDDLVEIKALTQVFTELLPTTMMQCAISSVKSNIGHCNTAAGFNGLIKTVKALEDRVIPPMAKDHFEKANPLINFSSSPFYIASELQDFNKTEVMYAGVSSFGMGGTNGHCILASYKNNNFNFENEIDENTENIKVILPFSARSINSRAQYEFRNIIIATTISDILIQLEQTKSTIHVRSPKENIIFIVPGQGSHSISIHRHIYKSSTLYQKKFKECVDILQKCDSTVPNLINYLEKDVYDTTYNPLLIFMSSYISAEILRLVFNIQISGIVGHSLGQYVAATLAGIFPLNIALAIVLKRIKIMQKMENGSMLATNLHSKLANNFIKVGKISLAAINEQNQCIFSGRSKDIEELAIILETQGYKIKMLNVTYGFHSHLTDPILDEFEIEISSLLNKVFKQSTSTIIPFISNTTRGWANVEDVPFMTKTQLIRLPGYSFNHTCSHWAKQTHQKSLIKTNSNEFVSSKIDQQPLANYDNPSTIEDRVILCFEKTLEFNINLLSLNVLSSSPTPFYLANSIKEILSTNISHTFNNIISSLENIIVYGFEYPGLQDSTVIEYHSIQALSEIYLKDLLKNDQSDTYNLFGSSFGGIVAYEMGCKLVKHGKSVNLIMVDTPTGQDMTNSTISIAEILHYTFSKKYNLNELIGIDDDDKALQIAIEKASILGMKQNHEIIPDNSVITILKRYIDVIKFNMKAMKSYQLPRSVKPIPIIYFKAKTKKNLDIECPEKSWVKMQEINGGKFECIELDGDHLSINFYPACKNITDYINQYFKTNYQQESAHFSCFSFLKRIKLMKKILS
ncbi:hypothetical protein C2G38_2239037 [Gigaspora rosea]|uniref:Uncharacterized protein n=1 Tax=Gigaspora rosea TaxID=44941 RepID=A0A397W525_9GLOM|nr:hypothetical protein C2G38_2239037 [Gigaspora rosea]